MRELALNLPRRSPRALLVLAGLLALPALAAWALEVRFRPVAEGVYAHIGDTGARTADNEGLNANIGLVVTRAGLTP